MLRPELQNAIDATIERIASEGSVLDVNEDAKKIAGATRSTEDHRYDEVALGLIKAAARRHVAMIFNHPSA